MQLALAQAGPTATLNSRNRRTVDGQDLCLAAASAEAKGKSGGADQQAQAQDAAARAPPLLATQTPREHLQSIAVHEAQRLHQKAGSDSQNAAGAAHASCRLLRCPLCAAGVGVASAGRGCGVSAHDAIEGAQLFECELEPPAGWGKGEGDLSVGLGRLQ